MKKTFLTFALLSFALVFVGCKDDKVIFVGTMTDSRDGKTYKTVEIGSQSKTWMAENLNYKMEDSYCYNNNESNCQKYGRLYKWEAAKSACPAGWHLPSEEEFENLLVAAGGEKVADEKLKSTSGWVDDGNGEDAFGFSALPAGSRYSSRYSNGGYCDEGHFAYFWSSSVDSSLFANGYAYYMVLGYDYDVVSEVAFSYNNDYGFSVRCVKD